MMLRLNALLCSLAVVAGAARFNEIKVCAIEESFRTLEGTAV